MSPVYGQISAGLSNWSMIAGATPAWARKVFPDLSCQEAETKLWDVIFDVCRVRAADPVAAWQKHICDLERRHDYLDVKRYRGLHFTAPGTDLKVGLPTGHRWLSGETVAKNGVRAVVNLPTEEIFTIPHRNEIDGVVSSTKPLSYSGNIIENFTLTFENGRVTKAVAEKGQTALDMLLKVDEGVRSLGEVALVPHKSPISQSNLLFYNILFDENASNHLALGSAYRYSLEGGEEMSEDAFLAAGGNVSMEHVDFMFGSAEIDVDGLTANGAAEPIMRGGEWVFDV
jgi:aminopeptidase